MPFRHRLIDIERLPPNAREAVIRVAEHFNAFIMDANELRLELNRVIGATPEEKAEMVAMFQHVRNCVHYLHEKRLSITLITLQVWLILNILKRFGLETENLGETLTRLLQVGLP